MTDDRDLTALLRDGMAAEARPVTADQAFIAETIALATRPTPSAGSRPPAWRGWIVPAVAAAIVALLIGSVFLGSSLLHSERHQPALSPTPSPTAPAPSHSTSTKPPTSKQSGSPTSPSTSPAALVPPSGGAVPVGFRAVDLTWTSATEGFALGTAPCQTAPCTSIVRTSDGGRHWVGLPTPKAELSQGQQNPSQCDTCIEYLRFATPLVGYAFGEHTMYLTTNGGATWLKQDGGAHALEVADGFVVRITAASSACPTVGDGCPFKLLRAPVGSNAWQDIRLPAGALNVAVTLARSGPLVVVGTFGNPVGGANNAQAVLFSSTDDGATWTRRADPCPNTTTTPGASGEVDTASVSIAADRSITALCAPRGSSSNQFTMTSTDDGLTFVRAPAVLPRTAVLLGSASAKISFVDVQGVLQRSSNGGASFSAAPAGQPTPSSLIYLGFESATVGRALGAVTSGSVGTPVVWTTSDAGATWAAYTFP